MENELAHSGHSRSRAVADRMEQLPQRQDALDDQLRDVRRAAVKLGCYDAADWIERRSTEGRRLRRTISESVHDLATKPGLDR